jgi:hypothetical protein
VRAEYYKRQRIDMPIKRQSLKKWIIKHFLFNHMFSSSPGRSGFKVEILALLIALSCGATGINCQ